MNGVNMSQWSLRPEDDFILSIDARSSTGADLDNLTDGAMAVPQPDQDAVVSVNTVASLDHSAISSNLIDLPFTNLDPSDLEGKEDLPDIDLNAHSGGSIESAIEVGHWAGGVEAGFYLSITNHQMTSDGCTTQISELFHVQETEVETVNLNGIDMVVSYENNSAFGFEGSFHGQSAQFNHLSIAVERGESFRSDMFMNGDPVLTSYGYYETVEIAGELFQIGITDFALNFEIAFELEMDGFGSYVLDAVVALDGHINFDHGTTTYPLQFEEHWRIHFRDLESVEFGYVPDGLSEYLTMIQFAMGDAWDGLVDLNDQLEAAFVTFRDDGHYSEWDSVEQGIDNPFKFDLPPVDLWV